MNYFVGFLGFWIIVYYIGNSLIKAFIRVLAPYSTSNDMTRKQPYILYWNLFTRLQSSIHAVFVVSCTINIIINHYDYSSEIGIIEKLLVFPTYEITEHGIVIFERIVSFMVAYLLVDAIFVVTQQTEKDIKGTLVHHLVGAFGMGCFAYFNILPFNGLYFMFTEITTPFLNICWAWIHLDIDNKSFIGKTIFTSCGVITWLLFLIVRVLGAIWLIWMLCYNIDDVMRMQTWQIIFCLILNPVICGLNWFWFYKLTKVMLGGGSK